MRRCEGGRETEGLGAGFQGDDFAVYVEEDVGETDNGGRVVGEMEDGALVGGAGGVFEVLGEEEVATLGRG